jgi:hypothetical protein
MEFRNQISSGRVHFSSGFDEGGANSKLFA